MAALPKTNLPEEAHESFEFYEFFSGGGMARIGLGDKWHCLFSNDFDAKKAAAYRANFAPAAELHCGDVAQVSTSQLTSHASLAWASFPCQDLSLAGIGKGLAGNRSGVFWSFWKLMQDLGREGRRPPVIALENVVGLLTSHKGQDLTNLLQAVVSEGYRVGALVVDGSLFVAQSRPRLFVIAVADNVELPAGLTLSSPDALWHPQKLQEVVRQLPSPIQNSWLWWHLPSPSEEPPHLNEVIEDTPTGVTWHTDAERDKILGLMSEANARKIAAAKIEAKVSGRTVFGTAYKRTRNGEQCAEVRFDGKSGCLRTPSGGSSRQIIVVVDELNVRTRLISPRETARLMGLPETYKLPEKYNDAYHLTGDGVVVPVVRWLADHLLSALAKASQTNLNKREPQLGFRTHGSAAAAEPVGV